MAVSLPRCRRCGVAYYPGRAKGGGWCSPECRTADMVDRCGVLTELDQLQVVLEAERRIAMQEWPAGRVQTMPTLRERSTIKLLMQPRSEGSDDGVLRPV